jgi:hypothetical protein
MLVLLMEGIYELRRWNDVHTNFDEDQLRHLSKITLLQQTV